jgi:hypothetical protein
VGQYALPVAWPREVDRARSLGLPRLPRQARKTLSMSTTARRVRRRVIAGKPSADAADRAGGTEATFHERSGCGEVRLLFMLARLLGLRSDGRERTHIPNRRMALIEATLAPVRGRVQEET